MDSQEAVTAARVHLFVEQTMVEAGGDMERALELFMLKMDADPAAMMDVIQHLAAIGMMPIVEKNLARAGYTQDTTDPDIWHAPAE